MLAVSHPQSRQHREIAGFLLALAFTALAAVRDVYLGGLFQHLDPLLVALTAFGLCSLGLLPLTLARDPGAAALLVRGALPLIWINVTTAAAWLSFFFALKTIEPALVQILFYGVGPLSVRWLDGRVPGSARATLGRTERSLHLGLLAALVGAAAVVLCGYSGLGRQPVAVAVRGVVLAVGGGVSIAISTLLCRGLNDAGMKPATLLSLRFPGAVLLAAAVALGQSRPLLVGVPAPDRPAQLRQPGGRGPGLARDRASRPRPRARPGVQPAARRGAPDVLAVDARGRRALRAVRDRLRPRPPPRHRHGAARRRRD